MFYSFKNYLNRDFTPVPKYYLTGNRKSQILHTRLGTNCSSLNNDLFLKNISESPLCSCGSIEITQHFFLRCPRYNEHRTLHFNEVCKHQPVSLNLLLRGSSNKFWQWPHKTKPISLGRVSITFTCYLEYSELNRLFKYFPCCNRNGC